MSSSISEARQGGRSRFASAKLVPAARSATASVLRTLACLGALAPLAVSQVQHPPAGEDAPRTPPMHERVGNPIELGGVRFFRDFDEGLAQSKKSGKPVFLQFQEIPGCSTCKDFGTDVLSHPLLVEAAETLFVPVAIRNNTSGDADAKIRERYKEPAWNNPVVRLVDEDGLDLVPRVAERWTVADVSYEMVRALKAAERPVPTWLTLVAEESMAARRGLEHAVFAMHCFWEGEVGLGAVDGVVRTLAGWHDGKEVVEVWFDPQRVRYDELLKQATARECASTVYWTNAEQRKALKDRDAKAFAGAVRPDREPKYRLRNTPYGRIPMTTLQQTRVNAAIGARKDPRDLLSARQLEMLKRVKAHPKHEWPLLVEQDLHEATRRFEAAVAALPR